VKLFKFQKVGVDRIHKFDGRALLADDMGLGKTLQALFYGWKYLPDDRPIVVVCPKNLTEHWKLEARTHLGMRAVILEKTIPPKNAQRTFNRNLIFIINPEILGSATGSKQTWNKYLRKINPQYVILDEAHMFGNPKSQRTRNVNGLIKGIKKVVAITGTPTTDLPIKLWPLLHMLRPNMFPAMRRFGERYCKPEYTPWGIQYRGATRLPELHKILKKSVMIRRLKSEVLEDLPDKIRTVVPIKLKPAQLREYMEAEKEFIKWMTKTHPNRVSRVKKSERMVKIGYLLRLVANMKMDAVKEWIDGYLANTYHKLIVFGHHKTIVRGFNELYPKNSVRLDGSTPTKERQQNIDTFLNDKNVRLFFGNMKSAGTGWSGKNVPAVAFVEFGWLPGDHTQAEDRVRGIGRGVQGMPSQAYYFVAQDTIDVRMCRIIQSKQSNLDKMLDGKASEGLPVEDLLTEALMRSHGKIFKLKGTK